MRDIKLKREATMTPWIQNPHGSSPHKIKKKNIYKNADALAPYTGEFHLVPEDEDESANTGLDLDRTDPSWAGEQLDGDEVRSFKGLPRKKARATQRPFRKRDCRPGSSQSGSKIRF